MQIETGTGTRHEVEYKRGDGILERALVWGVGEDERAWELELGLYPWNPSLVADLVFAYALSGAAPARQPLAA